MSRRRLLGTFDNAQALTTEHHAYNIVTAVRLSGTPDEVRLQTALEHIVRRHAILRAHVVSGRRKFLDLSEISTLPLERQDRRDDRTWVGVVERELAVQFDLRRPPLGRCTLIVAADATASELILTFPHALVDGTAVAQLITELVSVLAGEDAQTEKTIEKDLPTSCDELFPSRWQRPRRLPASLNFFGRQMANEIAYRFKTRGRHSRPPAGPFRNRILPIALTREDTSTLVRASRTHRVSLVATLEAAMLIAVVRHCYPGLTLPHRYCAFPLLRQYLEPAVGNDVVGCYITVLRLAARVSGDDDLWELAGRIHRDLEQSMRRGERFLASVWSHFSMRTIFSQRSHRMSTTALSYTGAMPLPETPGKPEIREVHAFVSNFPLGPQYTAQARLFRGRLWLDILYLDSDFAEPEARAIADDMRHLLTSRPSTASDLTRETGRANP